jgi:hypothetical protein
MEMVGGQTPRQRIWAAIRKHDGEFGSYTIARRSNADDETVYTYLYSLEKAGFIECTNPSAPLATERKWKLARDNGIEAPRVDKSGKPVKMGLGNEAMWRTMRILKDFDCTELAGHASTEEVPIKIDAVKSYVKFLHRAGYLAQTAEANRATRGRARAARFRMIPSKYTGPRPPMIQRTKSVYDPNLGKVVWQEDQRDEF